MGLGFQGLGLRVCGSTIALQYSEALAATGGLDAAVLCVTFRCPLPTDVNGEVTHNFMKCSR